LDISFLPINQTRSDMQALQLKAIFFVVDNLKKIKLEALKALNAGVTINILTALQHKRKHKSLTNFKVILSKTKYSVDSVLSGDYLLPQTPATSRNNEAKGIGKTPSSPNQSADTILLQKGSAIVTPRNFNNDKNSLKKSPSADNLDKINAKSNLKVSPSIAVADGIIKSGFLQKKGAVRKNWTTRWFVLKDKSLYYYKTPKDTKFKGEVFLQGTQIELVDIKKHPHCYAIISKTRTFYICATNDSERDEWLTACKAVQN